MLSYNEDGDGRDDAWTCAALTTPTEAAAATTMTTTSPPSAEAALTVTSPTPPPPPLPLLCDADEFIAELHRLQQDTRARQQRHDALCQERAQLQQLAQQQELACLRAQLQCAEATAALLQARVRSAALVEATAEQQAALLHMRTRQQQLREQLVEHARVSAACTPHSMHGCDNTNDTATASAADAAPQTTATRPACTRAHVGVTTKDDDSDTAQLRRLVLRVMTRHDEQATTCASAGSAAPCCDAAVQDTALCAQWLRPLVVLVDELRVLYTRHVAAATAATQAVTTVTSVAHMCVHELLDAVCAATSQTTCALTAAECALLTDALAAARTVHEKAA